ncbi:MAG: family ATPase, partial [Firmicutes bacterium]|nr:family ATPase [Bacillota bacterium]
AGRALEIDADLVAFLTGNPHLPAGVAAGPPPDSDRAAGLLGGTAPQQLIRWLGPGAAPPILVLHGPPGSGRRTVAALLAAGIGSALWMLQGGDTDLLRICRDAFLQHAGLGAVVGDGHAGLGAVAGDDRAGLKRLVELAGTFGLPLFLVSQQPLEPHLFREARLAQVAVPLADQPVREQIWLELLAKVPHAADVEPAALAATYRLTPGRIHDAFWLGREQAWLRSLDGVLTQADLVAGCKAQSSARLGTMARRLTGRPPWEALVLPQDQMEQLGEFCDWVRHRHRVLKEWGFGDGQTRGLGISALFAGGSGTGKTLAAEAVATKLGLDVYRIDLSAVVSKYIGETEKNLAHVFDAAEESHALLFFDEADALFGKRTEVKDAHDRYANIEINYLLQRMEAFDGLTVLATNRVEDLDEAFKRRLSFQISFPMPEQVQRRRIWQVHLPESAPLAPDVDLDFLAARLAVPGGNIRNIALGAAFLAAADGGPISMLHLVRAARREYEKAGRPCTEREFGAYLPLIQRERR